MSIIIISRGAHHKGEEVAEKTAQKLGYACISRDILLEASQQFNVPEVKLKKFMERTPGFFERLGFNKEKYISYIQSALLKRLKEDNIVYHGLAGHFFVKDISHALSVRILVDIKDRIQYCMQSEKVSESKARDMLKKLDEDRKKWGQYLYGIDISDPVLYDVVINIQKLSTDDAAEIICNAVQPDKFKTTPESRQTMEDLAAAAEVKAVLMDHIIPIEVTAQNGDVTVTIPATMLIESEVAGVIEELAKTVDGVKEVKVEGTPYVQSIEIVE
ncbi:MAG: cytidylate kinase family protein [Desulfosalsimonadaceae bacterium]|nr:cytidylate kinase family protein [Desulfosalsimonadaceae bacterium]